MTSMLTSSEAHLCDPLVLADQQIAEAEERLEHQLRVVSSLPTGMNARDYAEMVLREIKRTVAISRVQQALIRDLLG